MSNDATYSPQVRAQCDRCGWIYKRYQLTEEWTGYMVCPECWDPKTKQDFPDPIGSDNSIVKRPRPREDATTSQGQAVTSKDFISRCWRVGAGVGEVGEVLTA